LTTLKLNKINLKKRDPSNWNLIFMPFPISLWQRSHLCLGTFLHATLQKSVTAWLWLTLRGVYASHPAELQK
jgi:hypothetical protein